MSSELKILWLWPAWAIGICAGVAGLSQLTGLCGSWLTQFAWLAAVAALSGGPAWVCWRRALGDQCAAQRWLQRLCQIEPTDWARDLPAVAKPPAAGGSGWQGALDRLQHKCCQHAEALAEADHVRAAQEIRVRRALAQAERALGILRSFPEPVIAIDSYDALLLANASAEELLGINAEDAEKRSISACLKAERLLAALRSVAHYQSATTRTEEIELDACDGLRRWYSMTTRAIVDPQSGEVQGSVALLRDISARKASQRQNAEFVSAASHEMKTPLAGIKAYVELLADGDADDEETREEFLQVINGQADRLQRLIDNLLNIARIEAGVVKVSKESQPLNEILAEAYRVVQPAAEAKQIQLIQDLSPLYLGVLVDRDMLLQAAINLLSNAVKYTPVAGQVTLRSRLLDAEVLFEVEDNGVGLNEEDCQRVFDKFYRVEKDKQMAQGTGLGLPLVKYIVEDVHNGRISVTSRLGEGSVFQVRLPGAGQLG